MKTLIWKFKFYGFIFLMLSASVESMAYDFNTLLLSRLRMVLNSRDFDILVNDVERLKVLFLACEQEVKSHRLPKVCLELYEVAPFYKISKKDLPETQCPSSAIQFDVAVDFKKMSQQLNKVRPNCYLKWIKQIQIEHYKKSGELLE